MPLLKFKKSSKWYVDFAYHGRRRWAVSTDKRATLEFERQLLRLIDYRTQALLIPADLTKWLALQSDALARKLADVGLAASRVDRTPMVVHLEAYIAHQSHRELNGRHLQQVEARVRRVITTGPLTTEHVQAVMAELRKSVSAVTANKYLASCKAFAAWLVDVGSLPANPLARSRLLPELECRQRRALTRAEVRRLLAVTSRLHGAYRLALETGLRLGEIRQLTEADFVLKGKNPHVRVRASTAKNRRTVNQPLPTASVKHWRTFITASQSRLGFIHAPPDAAARMRVDLKTAKVRFETRDGVCHFHSLRHTYITRLALAGVPPAVVQRLARHSDIRTTLTFYTHVDAAALRRGADNAYTGP